MLRDLCAEREWLDRIGQMETALARNDSVAEFARATGLERGVTGYALHVVPVALYAWLRHDGGFRAAPVAALDCGGDTDTVGAILGALCGAAHGAEGIPAEWLDGVADWPRSTGFMRRLAERLAAQKQTSERLGEVTYFWPGLLPRNLLFLVVVLLHGFRRLLPPY
jgi:ADP-ribosylglycohydrolase